MSTKLGTVTSLEKKRLMVFVSGSHSLFFLQNFHILWIWVFVNDPVFFIFYVGFALEALVL